MYRYSLYILCLLALLGCQANKPGKGRVDTILNKGGVALGLTSSYEGVKRDFENGRIMQAREKAMAMDKAHKDYAKVRKLLQKKIEPSRQRLYTHYLNLATRAEGQGQWYKASQAYEQAREVSLKPADMERKQLQMEFKVRQLRLEALLKQRRAEDEFLLRQLHAYESPAGISPTDDVFLRKREDFEDELDRRAVGHWIAVAIHNDAGP